VLIIESRAGDDIHKMPYCNEHTQASMTRFLDRRYARQMANMNRLSGQVEGGRYCMSTQKGNEPCICSEADVLNHFLTKCTRERA
jgi:hypothetical protein